ncbi:PqqD family protein [Streptomyces lavendulae]|nr:PqqD family protein [Streptomyces lavendulae]TXJ75090.1 PqqD family protein [Streptomyces lavendulae]
MLRLREGAHPVLTDEGGAILDEHTGRWTYLTPTATSAVMLLLSSVTEAQAADLYAEWHGIPGDRAAADVRAVTAALAAQGIATPTQGNATRAQTRRSWRRWRR